MNTTPVHRPVVVGIDGSKAAVRAALWAVDEAIVRDVPLRLVYVLDPALGLNTQDAMAHAHHALHDVWERLSATGRPVKIESDIRHGPPAIELAAAARGAALLCVGAKRHKHLSHDGTAEQCVRLADAPVAIVRSRGKGASPGSGPARRWITVILDGTRESRVAFQTAIEEARLREAPVVALTAWSATDPDSAAHEAPPGDLRATLNRYLQSSQADETELQICALRMPEDVIALLDDSADTLDMVVAGTGDADLVHQLTGAPAHKALRGSRCSVLIARAMPWA